MEENKKQKIKRIHEGHNDANFDLLAKSELVTGKDTVKTINKCTEKKIEADKENTDNIIENNTENTEKVIENDTEISENIIANNTQNTNKIIDSDKENATLINETLVNSTIDLIKSSSDNTEKKIDSDGENTEKLVDAIENINLDVKTDNTDIVNSLDSNTEKLKDSIDNISLDVSTDNTDLIKSLDDNGDKLKEAIDDISLDIETDNINVNVDNSDIIKSLDDNTDKLVAKSVDFTSLNDNNNTNNNALVEALNSIGSSLAITLSTIKNGITGNSDGIDANKETIASLEKTYDKAISDINLSLLEIAGWHKTNLNLRQLGFQFTLNANTSHTFTYTLTQGSVIGENEVVFGVVGWQFDTVSNIVVIRSLYVDWNDPQILHFKLYNNSSSEQTVTLYVYLLEDSNGWNTD